MPRFFFDWFDGSHWVQDNLGVECASLEKALEEAQEILPEIARENLPSLRGNFAAFSPHLVRRAT